MPGKGTRATDQLDTALAPAVSVARPLVLARAQITLAMGKWPEAVPVKTGAAVRRFAAGEEMVTTGGISTKVAVKTRFDCMINEFTGALVDAPGLPSQLTKRESLSGLAVSLYLSPTLSMAPLVGGVSPATKAVASTVPFPFPALVRVNRAGTL